MKSSARTALPAVLMTIVSMVLTLAVVVMWLGESMHWGVALVVGLGIDGGWLATLSYDRRLAAQGDHSRPVTVVGWLFGLIATGVLVAHALGEDTPGPWLAVAWLPIAAKALWIVHGLWERTALTPAALDQIHEIQQEARDDAAVARARLRARTATEVTRVTAVTESGAKLARVQSDAARELADAWGVLDTARGQEDTARTLASVAERASDQPRWELPVWGPVDAVPALEAGTDTADTPPLSTPTTAPVDTPPALPWGEVYDQETDPAVSTMTSQVTAPGPEVDWDTYKRAVARVDGFPSAAQYERTVADMDASTEEASTPSERLDADAAKAAIEAAWQEGLTVREAAVRATRSPAYVGSVYARLTKERGVQPMKGQTAIDPAA